MVFLQFFINYRPFLFQKHIYLIFIHVKKNLHKIAMSANSWGWRVKALANSSTKNASFLTCLLIWKFISLYYFFYIKHPHTVSPPLSYKNGTKWPKLYFKTKFQQILKLRKGGFTKIVVQLNILYTYNCLNEKVLKWMFWRRRKIWYLLEYLKVWVPP